MFYPVLNSGRLRKFGLNLVLLLALECLGKPFKLSKLKRFPDFLKTKRNEIICVKNTEAEAGRWQLED